jgi:hypothetical protein
MTLPEQRNSEGIVAGIAHDFYGYAGAGPLTIERIDEAGPDAQLYVLVTLGDQGLYLERLQALELVRFITECCS